MPTITDTFRDLPIRLLADLEPLRDRNAIYFAKNGKYPTLLATVGTAIKMNTLPGEKEVFPVSLSDSSYSFRQDEKSTLNEAGEPIFGFERKIWDGVTKYVEFGEEVPVWEIIEDSVNGEW